ncbi:hypothetical protein CGLO_07402 [Colletotrichum gloeosporioides Cg-14]|uniref:Uncharacterized protein n=1 Tax=Colletotrichum gloeosporioides (strain Cg-14) TaxID=1237896 RepID=T0KC44_COLGC|nr:hypothetical protein CGLO_07402 [Colletotrichum gloeosporioides Cg-14]
MSLLITSDAWAKWQPVIEELYADYEFPVATRSQFNALLALYSGDGISFRTIHDHWRFVVDTIRSGDSIEDIVSICVIARSEKGSVDDGWVITRTCAIHGNQNADKTVKGRNLSWFKVTSDGRSYQHCCRAEVVGPYGAHTPWRSWEGTRLCINQHSYAQEIVSLRQQLEGSKNTKSSKRKQSEIVVIEDDIEESPVVKKLRKSKAKYKDAKTEAEDRAIAAENHAANLEDELATLRVEAAEKKTLLAKKDKAMDDLRRESAIKDGSLQKLRDQDLEASMRANEAKITDLASENNVLKGVVDSQKAEMEHLKTRLTWVENTEIPNLAYKVRSRNYLLEVTRNELDGLKDAMKSALDLSLERRSKSGAKANQEQQKDPAQVDEKQQDGKSLSSQQKKAKRRPHAYPGPPPAGFFDGNENLDEGDRNVLHLLNLEIPYRPSPDRVKMENGHSDIHMLSANMSTDGDNGNIHPSRQVLLEHSCTQN